MYRLLVVLPLATALALPAGCGYGFNPGRSTPPAQRAVEPLLPSKGAQKRADGTPDQEAIQAALDLLKAKSKAVYDTLKADAQPSAIRQLAGDLVVAMKGHDLGVAPAEFKAVWERHRKAWSGLQAAVARQADAYEGTDFTDALTGLFKDDPNRGKSLGGDMVEAVKAVTKSHAELYTSAEGYGLDVEK